MTCAVVVSFDGFSAPNVVIAVVEALRVFSAVPSEIAATFVYVPAVFGKTRMSSEVLPPVVSVPTVHVTLPLLPIAGDVETAVAPVGTPPKSRPAGRESGTTTVVPTPVGDTAFVDVALALVLRMLTPFGRALLTCTV